MRQKLPSVEVRFLFIAHSANLEPILSQQFKIFRIFLNCWDKMLLKSNSVPGFWIKLSVHILSYQTDISCLLYVPSLLTIMQYYRSTITLKTCEHLITRSMKCRHNRVFYAVTKFVVEDLFYQSPPLFIPAMWWLPHIYMSAFHLQLLWKLQKVKSLSTIMNK